MKKSQTERILQYLQRGKRINPLQALELFGCFRLGARAFDIKKMNYPIKSKPVTVSGKTFCEYFLR